MIFLFINVLSVSARHYVAMAAEAVKATVSYWKQTRSQQIITASASILFGLNLHSNYMLKSLISINLLFIK